jgi:HlyD family secretion protein
MKKLVLATLLVLAACGAKPNDAWLGYAEGEEALIAAPQAGWLTKMPLQRGQVVRKGDTLFVLDNTREEAGRDQAAAQLAQARATLAQERVNLAFTRTQLTRQDRLAQDGVGVPAVRDEARNAWQQSQARVTQLESQIAQMSAAVGSSAYTLSQRTIVSQIEGPVQDV